MNILLLRNNSALDLHHTWNAPAIIRRQFPNAHITTPAAAATETLGILRSDKALDEILVLPPGNPLRQVQAIRALPAELTVGCFGGAEISYKRHLLVFLAARGQKWVINRAGALQPAFSRAGIATLVHAALLWNRGPAMRLRQSLRNRLVNGLCRMLPRRLRTEAPAEIRRILLVRLGSIGDFIMAFPAIHALKAAYPKAKIDVLVAPGIDRLTALVPEIDTAFTCAPHQLVRARRSADGIGTLLSLARSLRARRYDLAVDAWGEDTTRLLMFASDARMRVGPMRSGEEESNPFPTLACLLTSPVDIKDMKGHRSMQQCEMLRIAGLEVQGAEPYRLPVAITLHDGPDKLTPLGLNRTYAVVHGSSRDVARMWPPERFAAVADYLIERHNMDVVITGAPGDYDANQSILGLMKHRDRAHDATGLLSMADLPALFFGARIMVTVDTGPMHIADICGTPLVALFLPMNAGVHYPFGQPEAVVLPDLTPEEAQNGVGNDIYLMGRITLKSVLEKVEAVMADTASRFEEERADATTA